MPRASSIVVVSLLAAVASCAAPLPAQNQKMPEADVVDVPAIAEGLCVSNVFQSNMVLQRDKPIAIWGWAAPGEDIAVSFGNDRQATQAAADRGWRVTLAARPANAGPISPD